MLTPVMQPPGQSTDLTHTRTTSKRKQIQNSSDMEDDENVIVAKAGLSLPEPGKSSSGRLIKPSKKLRQ